MMRPAAAATLIVAVLSLIGTSNATDFHAYKRLEQQALDALFASPTRTVIDLSGTWEYTIDGGTQQTCDVPRGFAERSEMTFRRQIRIDASTLRSHTWHMQFLGVVDDVILRINGRSVQKYPGGMVPFLVRIPDRMLTAGINTIELAVSPISQKTYQIDRMARYATKQNIGLIREAFLVGTPHVWSSDVSVNTSVRQGIAQIDTRVLVSGGDVASLATSMGMSAGTERLAVTIEAVTHDANGIVVARSNVASTTVERLRTVPIQLGTTIANPSRWTPWSPYLYRMAIRISANGRLIDERSVSIGIRTLSVQKGMNDRQIFLNDSAVFLNTLEYVESHPTLVSTMTEQQLRQDVALFKTLGINAIRIRNHAPHPYLVHLCDQYGIMMFIEVPASEVPRALLQHEEVKARMRNIAERLVSAYDHHPSVVGYGVSTSLQESAPEATAFNASLASYLKQTGRKLTYKTVTSTMIDDVSEGGFDVIILHSDTRSESARISERIATAKERIRSAAIIAAFGSSVSPDNSNGFSDPLSNQAQAVLIRDAYRASKAAGVAGICVWSFSDYAIDRPTLLVDHHDAYMATSGIVDQWRQPRVAFTMLKSLINDEKEPLLQAKDVTIDTPLIFIVTGLIIGLLLVALSNRSRRFREYALRSLLRPYNFYADIRDQRILSTVQTSLLGLVIATSAGLVIATLVYYLRTAPTFEYLLHLLIQSDSLFEAIRYAAWRPALAVMFSTSIVATLLLAFAFVLRLGAIFVKGRILMRDTLTIVVWSALPLVILLPVGIALYQLLSADSISVWIPLLFVATTVWFIFRSLRATSVVFDVRPWIVYTIGASLLVIAIAGTIAMYESWYDAAAFAQFFLAVVVS